ncbi:cytochrome P450 1A1 [Exaiptasia diaphana]|uniref:unspecific monooxygenase n=1 Tax=Exaiptasia diaphana TaxID=2652724 RepID=A0A913XTU9_EXADI|nr:cytochrome P450 1A1 [Exaiptasia diaphana]KXJ29428.1 Cytochrome P450 1A1 [Exaiptasia diaphana]
MTSVFQDNIFLLYIVTFVTAACVAMYFLTRRREQLLPPGPWSLPVVGNIFLFGSSPHKNVTKLAKHYGDVFSMKLGSRDVVLLNSVDVVKEALVKRASDFSGRPPLHTFLVSSNGGRNVAFTDFGSKYTQNRRALDQALQVLTKDSEVFSEVAQYEAEALVQNLLSCQKEKFNPEKHILSLSASFMMRMFFGAHIRDKYLGEGRDLMTGSTEFIENSAAGNTVDFMPWVKTVFRKQVKEVDDSVRSLVQFVKKIYLLRLNSADSKENLVVLTDHLKNLVTARRTEKEQGVSTEDPKAAVPNVDFDDDHVVHLIADSFGGGYEKLSTAMRWSFAYLVAYPEVQEQLYKEIQHVKGSEKITLNDRKKLPLLEATIMEVLRRSCFLPFALPHCTIKDTQIQGYKLPKNTIVFVNLWSCCHDPKYFEEPFKFNPMRYLDKRQQSIKPNPCMMALSEGDRKCPGEGYAKSALFVLLGTVIQKLKLRNGTEEPIEEKFGLTLRPKGTTIYVECRS